MVAGVLAALKAEAEADAELAAQAEADGITAERVFLSQAWEQIEQVAGREELAKALETVVELVPDADEDGDAAWRAQLVARYPTVRGDAFRPLRPHVQNPARAPVPARPNLPAHDQHPAQHDRVPPRPGEAISTGAIPSLALT